MVIELYGDISVICSHHVSVVDPLSDLADLFLDLKFILHFLITCTMSEEWQRQPVAVMFLQ